MYYLSQKIENTFKSLSQDNLNAIKIKYDGKVFSYNEIALLLIDVQAQFCDPEHEYREGNRETQETSERIQRIAPIFREASIPLYVVYTEPQPRIYMFQPDYKKDTIINKYGNSPFDETQIEENLHESNKKLLLVCGFNLSACVFDTVKDALKRSFNVALLEDLSGNGKYFYQGHPNPEEYKKEELLKIKNAGATTVNSEFFLENLLAQTSEQIKPPKL